MFQLDLSKIKEVQTDESLKGTGKMPVYVLAYVYTLRERKILSQRSSLTTKITAIKPNAEKEEKDFVCFTALTFTVVCRYILSTGMNVLGLFQSKIHPGVNRTRRDVSAIRQLNFLGLLNETPQLPTSMAMT